MRARDCPLLFSARVFLSLSPPAILTDLLVRPSLSLFLSLVDRHIYFNRHYVVLEKIEHVLNRILSKRKLSPRFCIRLSARGRLIRNSHPFRVIPKIFSRLDL